jgi:N-methylhydantoinase B
MTDRGGPDPITLELIIEQLIAVVREMRATMIRTAYSMTIYEMKDFSCALFDARRRMVAQSEDLPAHVVPLPWSVDAIMKDHEGEVHPGDVFLMNDAYRGGTHLNDVTMLYPIFEGEELVLLAANRSHWDDVGGMTPGSMSGRATEIYQEGIRIPPIKVMERGRPVRAAFELLYANMRVPEERQGDFRAMLATCRTAERRVHELLGRHGVATVRACIDRSIARTTERMRERIRRVPAGTYYAEDYLEFYHDDMLDPVLLRLALTVQDGAIACDFSGSSPQVAGVVNASLAVSAAGVIIALKALFDPDDPINHGTFTPITFTAPPGTVVNATPPVPCGAHAEIRRRTISLTVAALAPALPDRIAGDMQGTSNHTLIGGIDDRTGRSYVFYEVPVGGSGGFQEHDGPSVFGTVDWADNQPILPVESIEVDYPLEVTREEIATDSCGHGRRRGGFGLGLEIRVLASRATFSLVSDRAIVPPYGVRGGRSGAPNEYWINRAGRILPLPTPGKASGIQLTAGDVIVARTSGGGGYGDPSEREPELVAADVAAGFLSAAVARQHYRVVVDDGGTLDLPLTQAWRQTPREPLARVSVVAEPDSLAGQLGRHRVFRLHQASAARLGLGDGDLAELVGPHAVPLRGWVRVDDDVPDGAVTLDEWGRRISQLAEGAEAELRLLRRRASGDLPLAGHPPVFTGPTP